MLARFRNEISIFFSVCIAVMLLFSTACYRKGENIPTGPPTANSRLADGWQAFESGEYEDAIDGFTDAKNRDAAYIDAYNGLAWSYTRVLNYDQALPNFKVFMTLVANEPEKLIDAYAGLAAMYAASGDDQGAIEWAKLVVDTKSDYEFAHDTRVNATSLISLIAKSYYNLKDYLSALKIIQSKLNADFINTLKSEGILFDAIDDTVQIRVRAVSETPMSGQATMVITREEDGSPVDVSLVEILSITSEDASSQYEILSFTPGNNIVRFYGNPIPTNQQKLLVDYVYAKNFGRFLSRLLREIEQSQ